MRGPHDSGLVGGRRHRRGRRSGLGGRRLLGHGGRDRFGLLLGLRLALETPAVGQAADAVGRGIVDARGVVLHPDLELVGQLDDDVVLDAELPCELVDPDLLRGQGGVRSYRSFS